MKASRVPLRLAHSVRDALGTSTQPALLYITIVDYHGPVSTSARALVLSCGGDGSEPLENAGDAETTGIWTRVRNA